MAQQPHQMSDLSALAEFFGLAGPSAEPDGELQQLISRFLDAAAVGATGKLSDAEYHRMLSMINQTPGAVAALTHQAAAADDDLAPALTSEQRQQWMDKIHAASGDEHNIPGAVDFTVQLRRGSLSYQHPSSRLSICKSYDLARDTESVISLQHSQRLQNCEVQVTVEVESAASLCLRVKLTYVNPEFSRCARTLAFIGPDEGETIRQAFEDGETEFEDVQPGRYQFIVFADSSEIDRFAAEFRVSDAEDDSGR